MVCLHTSPADDPGAGDVGGMNVVVLHQAQALAAMGHQVEILTRRSSPQPPTLRQLADGLTLHLLDAGPARPLPKGEHEGVIEQFGAALAGHGPYDVVHSHHWFSGMAALPVARAWGVPHVQSYHSIAADPTTPLSEGERPESPGRLAGEAWLATSSDALVAVSRAEARTIEQRLGGRNVVVVPPGVDGDLFHPGRAAARPQVVVAARLEPLKGVDLAIQAVSGVPEGWRPDLVVSGAASGAVEGYDEQLRALARSEGVADRVHLVGPRSRADLAALMRASRVVLVPSHSETYGLVALEAAASGVPVLASATGGLREAVMDGVTGVVLDSRDPQVWSAALTDLLADDERRGRLGAAARQRALGLDWPTSARGLLAVYDELVPASGLPGDAR